MEQMQAAQLAMAQATAASARALDPGAAPGPARGADQLAATRGIEPSDRRRPEQVRRRSRSFRRRATRCPARRRNQVALALREGDVAADVGLDRGLAGQRRRRGPPTPRGSRSREGRQAGVEAARAAPAPPRSRPASNWARARAAIRRRWAAGSSRQAEPDDRSRIAACRRAAARRRAASAISSARTTRRGLRRSMPAASPGASARAARRAPPGRRRRGRPRAARGRPDRWAARRCRGRARRRAGRGPVPPARIATPPRAARSARTPRACAGEVGDAERLVGVDEVEAVVRDPRPLRGGRLGRADVQAAVDLARIGRDDLGHATARPSAPRASPIASPVLPVAVAPAMTTSGGAAVTQADDAPAQRVRPGVVDADGDQRGRPAPASRRGARACSRGCGPTVDRPGRRHPSGAAPRARRRGRAAGRSTASTSTSTSRPSQRLVALEPDPLLEREQLVQPAALDVGRDVVGEPRRRRAGPRRVGRGEDLVVADRLEQPQRRLELRPRSRRRSRR